MMISLFCSRAILSVSMMIFIVASFLHTGFKKHIRNFFSLPLLWSMSLLFFLPLFSGIWSDDKNQWLDIIRIKLPLLFLPLAFAGYPDEPFSKKPMGVDCFYFHCVRNGWHHMEYVSLCNKYDSST
jgi:hypothetical protein